MRGRERERERETIKKKSERERERESERERERKKERGADYRTNFNDNIGNNYNICTSYPFYTLQTNKIFTILLHFVSRRRLNKVNKNYFNKYVCFQKLHRFAENTKLNSGITFVLSYLKLIIY